MLNLIPDTDCNFCKGTGEIETGVCECILRQDTGLDSFSILPVVNYLSDKNDNKKELEIQIGLSDLYLTICQDKKQVTEVQLSFDSVIDLANLLHDWIVKNRNEK